MKNNGHICDKSIYNPGLVICFESNNSESASVMETL